ncbi:hypothetical protein [Spirochaeta dissipatitropha]
MRMKLKLIITMLLFGLATACGVNSPFLDQAADGYSSGERTGMRLNLDRGRTILPDYLDSVSTLHIELENLDTGEIEPHTLTDSDDYIIDLDPGMYSLTAEAENSLGQLVLTGSTEPFEIEIVGLVDVHLPLVYSSPESGQGAIDISWTFRPPADSFEPVELIVMLVDAQADEWDETSGDPEPYEFYINVPFDNLDNEWQEGHFSWTPAASRTGNTLDRSSLHMITDEIPAGHYHIAFMFATELEGGMGGAHSIQSPEIGEPQAMVSNGYYYGVTGPLVMWLETIRVDDGLVSKADFTVGSRHFGPMPTDVDSLRTSLDWIGTSGIVEYSLQFHHHENNVAYRVEIQEGDEWVVHTSFSSPSNSWIMADLWTETRFRMRPENFVGPGSWIEFTVDGDPQSPRMQILRANSPPPESWMIGFDLAPFSSTWFGITDGSGELDGQPADLHAYDMALSGQILIDAAVDSYARLWAVSGDSGSYLIEMVRDLKDGDPLGYFTASDFLEYPDIMIDSISSLAVDPEGEWLLAFGHSNEGLFALGASSYVNSPGAWNWVLHYIDLESEINTAVAANTAISDPTGFEVLAVEMLRNELHLIISVENELAYLRFDLEGMPEEISLSSYINLNEQLPYGFYLETFGIANNEPVLLYSSGEYPTGELVLMRLDVDAEILIQESSFSAPSSELTAAFARGTAAEGNRLIMLEDGTDYFFYRINEDFSIDFYWDEISIELDYPEV